MKWKTRKTSKWTSSNELGDPETGPWTTGTLGPWKWWSSSRFQVPLVRLQWKPAHPRRAPYHSKPVLRPSEVPVTGLALWQLVIKCDWQDLSSQLHAQFQKGRVVSVLSAARLQPTTVPKGFANRQKAGIYCTTSRYHLWRANICSKMVWEVRQSSLSPLPSAVSATWRSSFVPMHVTCISVWGHRCKGSHNPREKARGEHVKHASLPLGDKQHFLRFSQSTRIRLFPYTCFFQWIYFEHVYAQGGQWRSENVKISQWTAFLPNGVYGLVRWERISQIMKTIMHWFTLLQVLCNWELPHPCPWLPGGDL